MFSIQGLEFVNRNARARVTHGVRNFLVRVPIIFSFATALIVWIAVPKACTATSPTEIANEQIEAAFDCAALAATSASDPSPISHKQDVDRLFRYGVKRFRTWFPKNRADLKTGLGPWHAASNMSSDFWLGVFWTTANVNIDKLIEKKTQGDYVLPFKQQQEDQSIVAENEFRRRNCNLVGR